jgi:glutaredoxin
MGRITLYTADDLHSTQAKLALEERQLPYLEINVQRFPQKKKDLMTLAGTLAVPQAFFNTRLVGDLKSLMQELKGWDTSTKYKSPKARYEREIAKFPDPMSQNFMVPTIVDPIPAKELPVRMPASPVLLPDGTTTTVRVRNMDFGAAPIDHN